MRWRHWSLWSVLRPSRSIMASIYRRMLTFEGCSFRKRTKRFCSFLLCKRKGTKECTTPKAPFKGGCNRSSCRSYISVSSTHQRVGMCFYCSAMALLIANTMLKHLGVCRAAGGEKPPKSEGGGSERQRAGLFLIIPIEKFLLWFAKIGQAIANDQLWNWIYMSLQCYWAQQSWLHPLLMPSTSFRSLFNTSTTLFK